MKKLGCLFMLLLIGGVLVATNPAHEDHVAAVRQALKEQKLTELGIDANYLAIGQGLLGPEQMDRLLGKFIVRNNYYLFSLTQIDMGTDSKTVGVGVGGKVWLIDKFLTSSNKNKE